MSELYDIQIYSALKSFIEKACNIMENSIRKGESPRHQIKKKVEFSESGMSVRDLIIPSYDFVIFKNYDEFENLDEMTEVVEKRLQSKIFPRPSFSQRDGKPLVDADYIPSLKWSAIQFLFSYIEKNESVEFNESLFNKLYKEYEYYSITKKVKFNVICNLFNFKSDFDEFKIEDNLFIRKITTEEYESLYYADVFESRPPFTFTSNIRFVINTTYESDEPDKYEEKIKEKFYNIISALRLYKEGNLQYNVIRKFPISWTMGYTPFIGRKRPVIEYGKTYVLNSAESDSFLSFYNKYKESKNLKHLQISLSRLNFTYDRNRNEDKIIDILIGFESLFIEEKERPSDRGTFVGTACSMLIGKTYEDRKKIKKH
ncbi:hypothetical protein ACFL0D_02880 [Thermoproteota archaeon]